jgi:hypothetical protein
MAVLRTACSRDGAKNAKRPVRSNDQVDQSDSLSTVKASDGG